MVLGRRAVSTVLMVLLTLSLFVSAFFVIPTATGNVWMSADWSRTYGGTGIDVAYSVVQTSDGGYALAGVVGSFGAGNGDMWLIKIDSAGNHLWNKTYGGTSSDYAYSMVQTSDGGYALAGSTQSYGVGTPYSNVYLVKTTASGTMVWNKTYGGTRDDYANSMVQTSDGGYALAGDTKSYGVGTPSKRNSYLVKTDSAGTMLWNKTYGGASNDLAYSVVQTSDGGYALAGWTNSSGAGGYDFWLVKTDSSGNMQWNKTCGGTSWEFAYSVVQTGDGGYALAGYTDSFGTSQEVWLVKTDSSGNMQWNKTCGGTSSDGAYSMVQTSDGGYALAGYTYSYGAGNNDFWLVKTDSSGNHLWNKTCGGTSGETAWSVVQTSDGGYALAGHTNSYGAGNLDFWLVKLTPQTIYIRADGSVDPPTAPIVRDGNLYTLTDNIYSSTPTAIVVEKNGITLDGAGYTIQGSSGIGIDLSNRAGVTIKNAVIKSFSYGIKLSHSSGNFIQGNTIINSLNGIWLGESSSNTLSRNFLTGSQNISIVLYDNSAFNTLISNNITNNCHGVWFWWSQNNSLSGNSITANDCTGVWFAYGSSGNTLIGNKITNNHDYGIKLVSCSSNSFYHNNFVGNSPTQVSILESLNAWDDGYPSGGNYWSDYTSLDLYKGPYQNETGSDGIGDTAYVIGGDNRDNYPLMGGWAPHSTQYDWPMFRQNQRHTGYTESPAPRTNQTLWKYTTSYKITSSPAVVDHKVYVGSRDKNVYCLDALTGTKIWNYTTGGSVEYSSPAVVDRKVYVGADKVYCLDALTGTKIWNYTAGPWWFSSPVVVDGRVYIGSLSADKKVYCLNASTGTKIWNYTTIGSVWSSPAVADGKVYVASDDKKVYCLDAPTGTKIWNYTTGGSVWSSPAVVNGKVYVGSRDKNVYCLDAPTGTKIWNYTTGGYVDSSPAVVNGKVYVGSFDKKVYCLDALTGTKIWNYTTGDVVYSSPAVADAKVYVGSRDHRVYCLDALTGARVWSYTTGDYVDPSPAVADGIVFVGSNDYSVYALGNIIKVPEDYPTVQTAVNAAPSGATILIAPGVYHESVIITNKTLTILGEKGSGTTFTGGGSGTAFTISGSATSGTNVAQVTIINYAQGISIDNSAQCRIYDNIMYSMTDSGIAVKGSNAVNTLVYNNIFQNNLIAVNLTQSSTSNTVYGNTISYNNIGLILKSGGNTIYANTISKNNFGIKLLSSNDNFIYWNNFDNYVQQVDIQSSTSAWDKGYPMGGNYWSSYTGVDFCSGPTPQTQPGSDGIGDTPYTVYGNVQDHYPLMKPFGGSHDIGIIQVTCLKTKVGQGYVVKIEVTIRSYGIYTETRNIKIYANTLVATGQDVSLAFRHCTTVTFTWDTTSFAKGNYNIKAYATPITDDVDINDNTHQDGPVMVTIPGDANGDHTVNSLDIGTLNAHWAPASGTPPWSLGYDPNVDCNDDGYINSLDIGVVNAHWGQSW